MAICLCVGLNSCQTKTVYVDSKGNELQGHNVVYVDDKPLEYWALRTITINGEKHEFVATYGSFSKGIAHWPGCKYCKHNNNNK